MENNRMSNADMIQYCDEALAWEDFGPIDRYFFQSVKRILLGECSAAEEPDDSQYDLMGIERPVRDVELEPEYCNFADIYYNEEGDDEIPNYCVSEEDEAFADNLFSNGFFVDTANVNTEESEKPDENSVDGHSENKGGSFTVNI